MFLSWWSCVTPTLTISQHSFLRSLTNMQCPDVLPGLLHSFTWDAWCRVFKELCHLWHALCKQLVHTDSDDRIKSSLCQVHIFYHSNYYTVTVTDTRKLCVGLHVSRRPALRRKRRLCQWDKLSVSAQWKDIPAWRDHDTGLQHLVRTAPTLQCLLVFIHLSHPPPQKRLNH